ncbi:MAG: hypothetical protein CMM25_09010 [Rhodospirillaceae bacterium]|mgnify:CR=1 FL=1|nr:hypothetical protein [Rhodospirillaceae bacterium]|tara:strand:- start:498 stop:875 length:378 start_codon:yes stop_codon:yes gene_type:complete
MIRKQELFVIWFSLVLSLLIFVSSARAAPFVLGIEDLPLIQGLEQKPNSTVIFDTPEGRVIEAVAAGVIERAVVVSFYQSTLPQLGWIKQSEERYWRDGESLSLEFISNGKKLEVRFFVRPEMPN